MDNKEKYSVGALLYSPALKPDLAAKILSNSIFAPYSLAICLEDSISPSAIEAAELKTIEILDVLSRAYYEKKTYLPKIFIRVRDPRQVISLFNRISTCQEILSGFIFPKYSVDNAEDYNHALSCVNAIARKQQYMMPVLESVDITDTTKRCETLGRIKAFIDSMNDSVLNVRVGGNDFSNAFATRRHPDETIYDILPVSQILSDILSVFSRDYVVAGPVWEYFADDTGVWKTGLENELKKDALSGFVGKTVIHPNQIPVVNQALRVSQQDFEDAKTIVSWEDSSLQVGKSFGGNRMNEVRTNIKWAEKIMLLHSIYGMK